MVVTSWSIRRRPSSRSVRMPWYSARARELVRRGLLDHELADRVGDEHELVDADAVGVAGLRAEVAAGAAHELRLRCSAADAVEERELLGASARTARGTCVQMRRTRRWATTADDRRRDEEGLDAHVEEAVQRGGGVGGVQRREHEVAGQRRLHRDPRGLDVADLADQDDVGVLAQDRLQPAGEGDAGLLVDLDLVDRREARTRPGPRSS